MRIRTRPAVTGAAAAAAAIVAQLVCAKAVRDALFLSSFEVHHLPHMVAAAAVASLAAALGSSRAMAKWSPRRVLEVGLPVNAALYGLDWLLIERSPQIAAVALYLQVAVFGSSLLATVWSLVNESFDPHTAKRNIGRITMGATVGGALGGLTAFGAGRFGGTTALLGLLALLNLLALPAAARVQPRAERRVAPAQAGRTRLEVSPYLRQLATMVMLVAITSALLDYVMSARIVATIPERSALVTFFALFHMGVGVASFLVQALFTRAALERFGLAGTVAILPIAVLGAGGLALVAPAAWTALAARAVDALMSSSLYRAGYELLYTPVPHAQKRPAKVLIDVGLDRLGTGLGTGIVLLTLALSRNPLAWLIAMAMLAGLAGLWTALRLHRGYVSALAVSLQRGELDLSFAEAFDPATRRTLAETRGIDRKRLLETIERQRRAPELDSVFPPEVEASSFDDSQEPVLPCEQGEFHGAPLALRLAALVRAERAEEGLGAALDDLTSGDLAVAHHRLSERSVPAELVPAVIALLGRDELSRDALRALKSLGPSITGQLVDALLDSNRDIVVRRRVPRVLEALPNERAVQGLVDGLFDREQDVRHQSAWALQRLTDDAPHLVLPRARLLAAVRDEFLNVAGAQADSAPAVARSIEHAVLVLSLVLEREPLVLAYRALLSENENLRGTALEYLENVLPDEVRDAGLRAIGRLSPRVRSKRDARELRDELLRSHGG